MKITSKTLMVDFETNVKLGNNDAIELTLIHQAFIYEKEDGTVGIDINMSTDYENVKFLGIPIEEGYKEFKQFKAQLLGLGIDLEKLISEKEKELNVDEIKAQLTLMFRNKF